METNWKQIKEKLSKIAPKYLDELNNGVTDAQIDDLEKIIGTKLPKDFIEFYKVHDGCNEFGLVDGEKLLSFERIIDEWKVWKELFDEGDFNKNEADYDKAIDLRHWWNPLWIPFTYDGSGNHLCLDLCPTKKGKRGQIIRFWHDDADRELITESFNDWIVQYKNNLLNGQLIYNEDYEAIVDKEES